MAGIKMRMFRALLNKIDDGLCFHYYTNSKLLTTCRIKLSTILFIGISSPECIANQNFEYGICIWSNTEYPHEILRVGSGPSIR